MSKWNSHSHQRHGFMLVVGFIFIAGASRLVHAAPANITFSQSAQTIEAYDFVEITLNVSSPDAQNPFLDVAVEGQFGKAGSSQQLNVSGFCDSADGSVFRIRFMPSAPGDYTYSVVYRQGRFREDARGSFPAPRTATAAAPSASTPSTPGISSGRAPASTTSSTAPPPSGCWAGATSGSSTTASSACTA